MEKINYKIRTNYHTHNKLCQHASGDVEQYIIEAIKNDYEVLGFSDHSYIPNPKFLRCSLDAMNHYFDEVDFLKEKYQDKIKIFNGLEVDFFPEYMDLYKYYYERLDYLILAVHFLDCNCEDVLATSSYSIFEDDKLERYKDLAIQGIKSGLFSFFAHPDLFMYKLKETTHKHLEIMEEICKACKEYDMPVEYNANGIRFVRMKKIAREQTYPNKDFFKLVKKYELKVVISNDCHNPFFLNDDEIKQAYQEANEMELNIIENIKINK